MVKPACRRAVKERKNMDRPAVASISESGMLAIIVLGSLSLVMVTRPV